MVLPSSTNSTKTLSATKFSRPAVWTSTIFPLIGLFATPNDNAAGAPLSNDINRATIRAMRKSIDPFRILGIAPDATLEEAKAAFKAKIMSVHPDKAHLAGHRAATNEEIGEIYEAMKMIKEMFTENRQNRQNRKNRYEQYWDFGDDYGAEYWQWNYDGSKMHGFYKPFSQWTNEDADEFMSWVFGGEYKPQHGPNYDLKKKIMQDLDDGVVDYIKAGETKPAPVAPKLVQKDVQAQIAALKRGNPRKSRPNAGDIEFDIK